MRRVDAVAVPVDSLNQPMVACPSDRVQRRRQATLEFGAGVSDLIDVWQRAIVLRPRLSQTKLLDLLKLHPGDGQVRHELLEGPRLLCLLLVVQRDLLAELPGV